MKSKLVIPDLSWWSGNGMPVKEIAVSKKDLKKGFSSDEKTLIALATFPLLKKALIKSAIVFALMLIGIISAIIVLNTVPENGFTVFVMIIVCTVLLGMIFSVKTAALIDGFDIIDGSARLGLSFGFRIGKFLLSAPSILLGGIACLILQLFNRFSQAKMFGMPRIGMPQNVGYDEFLDYYSEYERSVNAKAPLQSYAHMTLPQVEDEIKKCKNLIKEIENNPALSHSEKTVKINEVQKTKKGFEEIKSKLEKELW